MVDRIYRIPFVKDPPKTYSFDKESDEIKEENIPTEEWEAWRTADAAEWAKVESTGAVKTLSLEESEDVERQLKPPGWSADGNRRSSQELPQAENPDGV